jgi:CheY-like chemotaxis protein
MAAMLRFEIVPLSEVPPVSGETARPLVLVVDNEPLITDTLAKILSNAGFDVRTAYSAREALSAARERAPGFLLTDVQMPEIDGIQLAVQVAQEFPACQILLFSGHASGVDLERARSDGYSFPLIEKPIYPEYLVRYIAGCFDGDGQPSGGAAVVTAWQVMHSRAS